MTETGEGKARGAASLGAWLADATTTVLAPLRTVGLAALGGAVLAARAARRRLTRAADESERQLDLFAESVWRTTARLWRGRRKGPHPTTSSRSSRRAAAS
jgi:hypothetical protein